ncbi:MAG TPA: hypothetical protein VJ890_29990 [Vineibacter sp.]|nr:hypothetical protein [Vineibacter sp.]
MEEAEINRATHTANPGYAAFQIAKALTTAERHDDPATRERARERITAWASVLTGMMNGSLTVGSRTPVENTPGWVTLKVVTGGFATGQFLASGPLLDHERALLERLSAAAEAEPRRRLNAHFLTDDGLSELQALLVSGTYDVSVPEEGALLAVAWLALNNQAEVARRLLDDLAPYFDKLRFYPSPADRPFQAGARVFLQSVGQSIAALERVKPNQRVQAHKEAVEVWVPLYDRLVGLFIETVVGELPNLVAGPGAKSRAADGKYAIAGGWPCQHYAADWPARARDWLETCRQSRTSHTLSSMPHGARHSLAQLSAYLERCVQDPRALTGRDVGRIRLILARYIAKRGAPGSSRCDQARIIQRRAVSGPVFGDLAGVLVQRLKRYPEDGGLDEVTAVTQPVTAEEVPGAGMSAAVTVPPSLVTKVERSLVDSVDVLVARGIITSGETLARLLPQITSHLRAAGIADPSLRGLYAAVYRAFRRRRSLLLFDLQSQIRIEELPWVAAIETFRRNDMPAKELARQTLAEVAVLTLTSFPHAILPNKLLQELRALSRTADLDLPLVDEVAADIFMGRFSLKFRQAALQAAVLLKGTIYQTYYGIDYGDLDRLPERPSARRWWQFWRRAKDEQPSPDPFAAHCARRAGVLLGGWDPATNGMIIEQQQILTSQNLAALFIALGLTDKLRNQMDGLARTCFAWVCRRQQVFSKDRHAQLIMVKNTAYAWRQMVFFLALSPQDRIDHFLTWAEAHLDKQAPDFKARFSPALRGLKLAASGRSIDREATAEAGARRFLGWSTQKHWLLP